MAEQTNNTDMSDEADRQHLEDRVDQLESTISNMLPSRRDALKLGGAALVGGAAMSGSASAGTQQAGTIGTANDPVDVESEDINNADTVTTQDLVVNGTATGVAQDLQGARVFLSARQNLTAGSRAKVQFDAETYDSDNNFDTTTHAFTCPQTGVYSVQLQIRYLGGGDNQIREVSIGSSTDAFPNSRGAIQDNRNSQSSESLRAVTVNKYNQGDTIAAHAINFDANDELRDGDKNASTFLEVAFLGSL